MNNSEPQDKKEAKRYSVLKEHVHTDQCNHSHDEENLDEHCYYKGGALSHELFSHLPFSVLSVTVGILIAGLICFVISPETIQDANILLEQTHDHNHGIHENHGTHLEGEGTEHLNHNHEGHDHSGHDHSGHDHSGHDHSGHDHSSSEKANDKGPSPVGFLFLFHLFHPAHILFSALATTAMFYKYDKSLLKAIIIGFFGSIAFCTVSDAVIPTFTARMIGYDAPIHLCILETPMQIIPFAVIGVLLGLAAVFSGTIKSTISSHSLHVATSTMATLFYTIAYSNKLDWINSIGTVFMMTVLAVGGICCLSDVIFPMMFTKDARKEYGEHGHQHPH